MASLLLLFIQAVTQPAAAQNTSAPHSTPVVTLTENNVSLKKVFTEISKQTGISIMYDEAIVRLFGNISIRVKNVPLQQALNECLKNSTLDFRMDNNTIIIQKKAALPPQAVSEDRINIRGSVTDEDGKSLEGVTVLAKGTSYFLATGLSGQFGFGSIPAKGTLVFSCIGYQSREIPYDHQTEFSVTLKKRATQLGEVTVQVDNGYQTLPRERTTGSFEVVDSALFNRSVSPNFLNHIDGVTNSIYFDNRSLGSINSYAQQVRTPTFFIRGLSTINSQPAPLVIVDGFPYNSIEPYLQDINDINPNDIESITILKDAAAASIWGSRAGNGVVVITTKSGKYNQKPQVNVNSSVTLTSKPDLLSQRLLSTSDYIDVEKSLFSQDAYASLLDPTTSNGKAVSPVVDLLNRASNGTLSQGDADAQIAALSKNNLPRQEKKYFYRTGADQQYNVSVRGGGPTNKYYISAGYDKGMAVDYSFRNRFTLTATNVFKPIAALEFSLPVSYTDVQQGTNYGSNTYDGIIPSYSPLADAHGQPLNATYTSGYSPGFIQTALAAGLYDMNYNPINQFHAPQYNHTGNAQVSIAPSIRYNLPKGFSAELKYQYSKTTIKQSVYQSDSIWSVRDMINFYTQIQGPGNLTYPLQPGGLLNIGDQQQVNNNVRATLGYNHDLGDNHRIDALAGYERNETRVTGEQNGWYGYDPATGTVQTNVDYITYYSSTNDLLAGSPYPASASISSLPGNVLSRFVAYISSFANAAYTYQHRYVLSGSARFDRANLFGASANDKKKIVWSGGASWQVDRESFYKWAWLPQLKLRATFGYQGTAPAFFVPSLTTIGYRQGTNYSNGLPFAVLYNPPNPNLSWERIGQANIGVDFATKESVLSGMIEYYSKKGTNLVAPYPTDPSVGVLQQTSNVADMTGQGIDLNLAYKAIDSRFFKWTTRLIFNHNTDKLTKYFQTNTASNVLGAQASSSFPSGSSGVEGKAVLGVFGLRWAGLDNAGNPMGYDTLGKPGTNYSSLVNNARIRDLVYFGSANPTYFGSFINDFSMGKLTVSVNITYKAGYYFHAQSVNYSRLYGYGATVLSVVDGSSDYAGRWRQPGDEKHIHVPSAPTLANADYLRDEFYQYSSVLVQKGDNIRLKDISLSYDLTPRDRPSFPFASLQVYGYYLGNNLLWKANGMGIDPDYSIMKPARSYTLGLRLGFK